MKKDSPKRNIPVGRIVFYIIAAAAIFIGAFFMADVLFFDETKDHIDIVFEHSKQAFIFLLIILAAPILIAVLFLRVSMQRNMRVEGLNAALDQLESDVGEEFDSEYGKTVDLKAPENYQVYTSGGANYGFGMRSEARKSPPTQRFTKLLREDIRAKFAEKKNYDGELTLEKICKDFRNFAASKLGLYYDLEQIRRFVAGMGTSKILIMQGMSGTGKTSLAFAFGEYLSNPSTIVPIQPMWKDRSDLVGYYNEFTKKFNETTLLEKMYEANRSDDIYVTVLDEMNIARVEYYFAEFLSLLEIPNEDSRYLDIIPDVAPDDPVMLKNGKIKLPTNMWFIGTANNDDSTFAIADKVYDRAMVMNLDTKAKPFSAPATPSAKISVHEWNRLVKESAVTFEMTERNKRRIAELDNYMIENFHISFGNRIMKQISVYVPLIIACGGDEVGAIDDILSKKVLRKLEACNPIYVKNSAEAFRNYLDELFGIDKMKSCKSYLMQLERNA